MATPSAASRSNWWDVPDRARAEAALHEYAEDLRRSNEDLERFAYVSSHDLQ
jgi:light-regulated signal transduction histidine kinase (bacteriophytochrome)